MVKHNGDSHRGTGFVKFKKEKDAHRLLKLHNELADNPEKESLLDPRNFLKLGERRLNILPLLGDGQLKSNKLTKEEIKERTQLKGEIDLEKLMLTDVRDKKNFYLAKKGLYIGEENVESENEKETQKRKNHLADKLMKMRLPNMKISPNKMLFKNISKKLDKPFFHDFVKIVLRDSIPSKKLKTMKVIKNIKVLKD